MRLPALSSLALAALLVFQSLVPLAAQAEGEADPLWNRPSYEKKITRIGQRIQAANGITERILFIYSREHVINATADRSRGNNIVVYEDLLTLMDSDDELAAVLSHEIAHITLRHQRRGGLANLGVGLMMGTAIAAAAYSTGVASPVLTKLSMRAGTAPISRRLEKEADLAGLDYLVKAGYNPLAMEVMMNKIAADGSVSARFFSDHPMGTDRLQYIHTAIVNRFPQFLTAETRNNLVPGSPYQVQPATTIPNRTVYASPNGVIATTANLARPTMPAAQNPITSPASLPSPTIGSVAAGNSTQMPSVSVSGKPNQPEPTKRPQPSIAAGTAGYPASGGVLMLASANTPAPSGNPTTASVTPFISPVSAADAANTAIAGTSALIERNPSSPLVPPPARIQYQTSTTASKIQPKKVPYTHSANRPTQGKTAIPATNKPKTAMAETQTGAVVAAISTGATGVASQAQPASIHVSVAQTLLNLQPDALRLVKLVSQRGMISHQDLVVEFEGLEEAALEAMLLDLQTNKQLLTIQGAEPDVAYTLTPRAARVLRPQ